MCFRFAVPLHRPYRVSPKSRPAPPPPPYYLIPPPSLITPHPPPPPSTSPSLISLPPPMSPSKPKEDNKPPTPPPTASPPPARVYLVIPAVSPCQNKASPPTPLQYRSPSTNSGLRSCFGSNCSSLSSSSSSLSAFPNVPRSRLVLYTLCPCSSSAKAAPPSPAKDRKLRFITKTLCGVKKYPIEDSKN